MDLYEVLEVAPSADAAEIRAAITRQRRVWIRRQASPDPTRRTEAEERVRLIDDAEKTLLDPNRRAAFDRRQDAGPVAAERPPQTYGSAPTARARTGPDRPGEWRDRATAYLEQGNPGAAHRAAARACADDPTDVAAWELRGRAALAAGDAATAEEELAEALRLGGNSIELHLGLGSVHLQRERWERAIADLQPVLAQRPEDPVARAGIATAYVHTRRGRAGRKLLAAIMKRPPNDLAERHTVAAALYDAALTSMTQLVDGSYLPLSRRQVALATRYGRWIKRLQPDDSVQRAQCDELLQLAKNARKAHWLPSRNKRWYALALVVAFVPSVLRGDIYSGNFAWAMCAVVAVVYIWRHRRPTWKLRRRELANEIGSNGI